MHYSLGVDLGTSFTAVAIADDLGTHAAQLSPLLVVPSAIYVSPDGTILTGDTALIAGESDPSRLVRGFKKRLGDPTPLIISGVQYTPEQLMALQLREVVAEVAEQRGEAAQAIVLTYPVTWGPYRAEHFSRIAELSGVEVRSIITEPVATATHLDTQGRVKEGDIVAIVDFGNDAVTVTLLRKGTDGFGVLGTPEDTDHVGSVDFDDAIRTLLDQKLGGMISALDSTDPADAAILLAIDNACNGAKETLSARKEAAVSVTLPDGVRRLSVTRDEFTQLIRPSVRLAVSALRRTIGSAEIDEDAITSIVLTGGASRIPLVAEEFAEIRRPVRSIHHPKLAVALGAAHTARALAVADEDASAAESARTALGAALASPASAHPRIWWPLSRRAWTAVAGVFVVILALLAAIFIAPSILRGSDDPAPLTSSAGAEKTAPPESPSTSPDDTPDDTATEATPTTASGVFENGTTASGLRWYIATAGEANDWGVAPLDKGVAHMPGIALSATGDALRATWATPDWSSQFYAQFQNEVIDLKEIADADGALAFDLTLLSGSARTLQVAAHCVFPCAGAVDITDTVDALTLDSPTHLIVPAECFISNGLDISNVNTPFLLIGQGDFALKVENIRWEDVSGANPEAVTC